MSMQIPMSCTLCNTYRVVSVWLDLGDEQAQFDSAFNGIKASMAERCGGRDGCPHRRDDLVTISTTTTTKGNT